MGSVNTALQTSDGYIWIGTQEGLVRFDGVKFEVFKQSKDGSITFSYINSMIEDKQGTLWFGTRGNGLISFKNNRFQGYSTQDGLLSNTIFTVITLDDGTLWLYTPIGINIYKNGKISKVDLPEPLVPKDITTIRIGINKIWVGTNRKGLFSYIKTADGYKIQHTDTPKRFITNILETDNTVWIGTRDDGLIRFNKATNEVFYFNTQNGLTNNYIRSLHMDKDGNLWAGTRGGGLYRIQKGSKIERFSKEDGLTSDIIDAIFEDTEGSLWLGTYGGGLNRLKDEKIIAYSVKHGLSSPLTFGLLEDRNGNIWICTDGGGVNVFKDTKFKAYTTKEGLGLDSAASVCEDTEGYIWIGTLGPVLSRFKDGKFKNYTAKDGLVANHIWPLYADSKGHIWIGTDRDGVNEFYNGKFTLYNQGNGLSHNTVTTIREDSKGYVWVGTLGGGLNRIKDGKIKIFTVDEGLSSNLINYLYEDTKGMLWVGTYDGGLNRYKEDKFEAVAAKDGLFNDLTWSILEDDHGTFWLTCNQGIYTVSRKDLEDFFDGKIKKVQSYSYGVADGMLDAECDGFCFSASLKTRDGRLIFPTIKGIAVIDPANMPTNTVKPPVVVEKVIADGREHPAHEKIILSPGTRSIELHYTALSFLVPRKVLFKYKLEGYDEDWLDVGTRRIAYYTNLPPGNYRFKVIACNNDGLWNEEGASFDFYIEPYFYQATWFRILAALAIIALIFTFIKFRIRQLERHKKELEQIVEERTQELAEANRELKKLATKDPLTGLNNKRRFFEFYGYEWKRAIRHKNDISLILIDIDYFKNYNDTYGHQEGDECLKQVATAISKNCRRATDFVARYGGEEFIVILPHTDSPGTKLVAENIRKSVEGLKIEHSASEAASHVTISLGFATAVPKLGHDAAILIEAADKALYESKLKGRNRATKYRKKIK